MDIVSHSVKETKGIAKKLSKLLNPGDVIALVGNLGSGKTVFVKGLASGLGLRGDDVLSPTFVLMQQYQGKAALNHFDLYRLSDIGELQGIGYEEYFYGDGISVIEWADRISEALPEEYLRIEFKIKDANTRLIRISPKGKRYAYNFGKLKRKATAVS